MIDLISHQQDILPPGNLNQLFALLLGEGSPARILEGRNQVQQPGMGFEQNLLKAIQVQAFMIPWQRDDPQSVVLKMRSAR